MATILTPDIRYDVFEEHFLCYINTSIYTETNQLDQVDWKSLLSELKEKLVTRYSPD